MKGDFEDYQNMVLREVKSHRRSNFFRPHYSRYSLPNISPTILSHFAKKKRFSIDDEPVKEMMEGCETIVLILVDGLGYGFFKRSSDANELSSMLQRSSIVIPITSTFPSTTTTALTSLNTGLTPQEHGIVGHTMYLKQYGIIANMIRFSPATDGGGDGLARAGLVPEEYLKAPTIYESLAIEGINSTVLTRWVYRTSMLSRMLHNGATVVPYVNSPDLFVLLAREVMKGTRFIFAYWDALDTSSHAYGPNSTEVEAELRSFLFSFVNEFTRMLERKKARKTCLMITGDHGLVYVDRKNGIIANDHVTLMRNLERPPAGDTRASFLKVADGKRGDVEKFFERFRGRIDLLDTKDMIHDGFFGRGRMSDGVREAIADVVALSRKGTTFRYRFRNTQDESILKGHHGGLTDEELFVPLITLRASAMGAEGNSRLHKSN